MNLKLYYRDYVQTVMEGIESIDPAQLDRFLERILRARAEGKKIIFAGNGGGALNASHFSMGISVVAKKWNKPFKSVVLSDR